MATNLVNLVEVPCVADPAGTTVQQPDGAAVFRAPTAQPLNLASGSSIPKGPQVWPV